MYMKVNVMHLKIKITFHMHFQKHLKYQKLLTPVKKETTNKL